MLTFLKSIVQTKDKFLQMDLITKRTHYKCKDDFVVVDSIKNWTQYVVDNDLKSSISEELNEKTFDVDDEINSKISLWQGDITHLEIDAIVNAANSTLLGGGGVDGCIHRAAGPGLYDECKTLIHCDAGSAKITGGYRLPAKYVIHAVGPQGEKPAVLKSTYETCLNLILENQLKSAAFPCISTGIYGYPPEKAVHVAALSVRKFLENHKTEVDRIIFTVFLESDKKIYEKELLNYFPTNSSTSTRSPKSSSPVESQKSTAAEETLKSPTSEETPKSPTSEETPRSPVDSPKLLQQSSAPAESSKSPASAKAPKTPTSVEAEVEAPKSTSVDSPKL